MATADDLITGIRYQLSDETDEAYGDALLINFLNDGATEFATTTGCCQDIATITPDGSNSYVDLSTSNLTYRMLNVYAVEFSGVKLDHAPKYEAAHWNPASGTPTGWSVWADDGTERLYFDTIPAATANAVKVHFTYIPTAMTTTSSVCGIPEKWNPAIKHYAVYRVHDRMRETGAEYSLMRQVAAKINEALMSGGGYSR